MVKSQSNKKPNQKRKKKLVNYYKENKFPKDLKH
jgi:hypothetical protein